MCPLYQGKFILTVLSGWESPNDEFGTKLQKEIIQMFPTLSELELRIRRSVVFAPLSGVAVTKAASECIELTRELYNAKKGNLDIIINKMNEFNIASRKAHAEMLGLSAAEQQKRN